MALRLQKPDEELAIPAPSTSTPSTPTPPIAMPAIPALVASVSTKFGEKLAAYSSLIGLVAAIVGGVSVSWLFVGRPDGGFGTSADRWNYLIDRINSNRVDYAFLWDLVFYQIFQVWLIWDNTPSTEERVSPRRRQLIRGLGCVPFFGLAAYLIAWPLQSEVEEARQKFAEALRRSK